MKRSFSMLALVALIPVLAAIGCGGSSGESVPSDVKSLFPTDNEVSGWGVDPSGGTAGVEVMTTEHDVEARIDGDITPFADTFTAGTFSAFAVQDYIKGTTKLEMRIWRMKTVAASTSIYQSVLSDTSHGYAQSNWIDLAVGDSGRIATKPVQIWINVRKNVDYIELKLLNVSPGGDLDASAGADAQAFINAVMAKYK